MQDIPRNELLDKLAAGWKCRKKVWSNDQKSISKKPTADGERVRWWELVADDWEGEPPKPSQLEMAAQIMQGGTANPSIESITSDPISRPISAALEIADALIAAEKKVAK